MTRSDVSVVDLERVRVSLGGTRILHGIDLSVAPGELLALLGANGSGKSTLLKAIAGVIPVESGTARLFGQDVRRSRAHARLGYVPQDHPEAGSIPTTARETVATGLLGPGSWFLRPRDTRVTEALEAVHMLDLAPRPITKMSGGQRRRVMIARALVRNPELLILDEPFSGIDLDTQVSIAQLFRDLWLNGTSIIVVLHELGPLGDDITRAAVLDRGRLVHDGDPADRPLLDPGHDHGPATPIDDCIGQEIHPA